MLLVLLLFMILFILLVTSISVLYSLLVFRLYLSQNKYSDYQPVYGIHVLLYCFIIVVEYAMGVLLWYIYSIVLVNAAIRLPSKPAICSVSLMLSGALQVFLVPFWAAVKLVLCGSQNVYVDVKFAISFGLTLVGAEVPCCVWKITQLLRCCSLIGLKALKAVQIMDCWSNCL